MKIVNLSTYDLNGGAARASYRIHKEFQSQDIDSKMLVLHKTIDDNSVISVASSKLKNFASKIDNFPLRFYEKQKITWSTSWFGFDIAQSKYVQEADVIILYWVAGGFLSPNNIYQLSKLNKKIIWRLSDMLPFTGGCHYSGECDKYKSICQECTQINSSKVNDISNRLFNKKIHLWKDIDMNIVCPSNWMESCVKKSAIFKSKNVSIIPTGVDREVFKKIDKKIARNILNLPADKKILLLGAVNINGEPRKGGKEAYDAIKYYLKEYKRSDIELVVFGSYNNVFQDLNINITMMGKVNDEYTLALLYSAADVFLAPSKEENLANTVLESLSCNTPVVAFNIGGMPDVIKYGENGFLVSPYNIKEFSEGIDWCLNNVFDNRSMLDLIFSLEKQVKTYINLCKNIQEI